MEPWLRQQIHCKYEQIKEEVSGGRLFGQTIDWDDREMAVVAAYYLSDYQWSVRRQDELELANSIQR